MMKLILKFKNFLTALILIFTFSSCSDSFLDKELIGINAQSGALDNPDNIRLAVNGAYNHINAGSWQSCNFNRLLKEASTDDAWGANDYQDRPGELGVSDFSNVTPVNSYVTDLYKQMNNGIRATNFVMSVLKDTKVISPELRDRYTGELKFLRAFFLLDLVTTYGETVINTTYDSNDAATFPKRSPVADVYKQIIKDLEEAAAVLPEKDGYAPQDIGRATKVSALGLLARAALYSEDYAKAESAAASVIAKPTVDLESRFSKIFEPENFNGKESLFEVNYGNLVGFGNGPILNEITGAASVDGGWGWFGLTSDLENAYIAEKDDVRRKATINKAGEAVDNETPTRIFPEHKVGGKPGHTSYRYHRKYYLPLAKRVGVPFTYNNIKLRLGEVYLIHAEAAAFNNKPEVALNSLNKIRARVGLPSKSGISGDALKQAIWNERRLELAGEGTFRWEDIRRIKINGKKLITTLLGPNGTFVNYNTKVNKDPIETAPHREALNKGFFYKEGVHDVWPIPQSALVNNKELVQNPGYN
jgi:starch-binding outer membrane protein, SusD/RagB family